MEARHCLSAANVIFGQTGKISTEDSKFIMCMFYYTTFKEQFEIILNFRKFKNRIKNCHIPF